MSGSVSRPILTVTTMTDPSERVSDILGDCGWVQSARLQLLDFAVAVHSDIPAVVHLIDELYAPLARAGPASHALMLGTTMMHDGSGYFTALDGSVVARTPAPTVAFAHLLFEANQQAIEQSPELIRIHSAAVAVGDRAVILPGPMGAGKSTLAAGLTHRGLGYITDEVVAIDRGSGLVRTYPKPISLGAAPDPIGSIGWEPSPGAGLFLGASGVIPARTLGHVDDRAHPVGLVVLPLYVPGAATELVRLPDSEALAAVASHTFHLDRPGTLDALAGVLAGVPCYHLVSGSLPDAVDAVLDVAPSGAGVR